MNVWLRRAWALVAALAVGATACGDSPTAPTGGGGTGGGGTGGGGTGGGGTGGGGTGGGGTGSGFRTLALSSFLGGSDRDDVRGMTVDGQGNVYLVGHTWSPNFPVTPGSFDPTFNSTNGTADAFVMKVSPSGNIIWSSFLGGPDLDFGMDVKVDAAGFVYVAGQAGPGFPVTAGALQTVHNGGLNSSRPADGYVCKIKPDGTDIVFCTYFGSSEGEVIRSMAIDQGGDIYVAPGSVGQFPQQWFTGAIQPTRSGDRDLVVARISSDGSSVVWATYLGGVGKESGETLVVGPDGSLYVACGTQSPGLPTPGGFDGTLDGPQDVYIARIAGDGSAMIYGTYLGGSGREGTESHHLGLGPNGDLYVSTATTSPDFPVTPGTYDTTFSGGVGGDAFVARLNPNGGLVAATYLGGGGDDFAETIDLTGSGTVFISGSTLSTDFPATDGGLLAGSRTAGDVFVAAFSPDLDSLLLSTLVGGSSDEFGRASTLDPSGNYYVSGHTESTDWPTMNPDQGSFGGGQWDSFLLIYKP